MLESSTHSIIAALTRYKMLENSHKTKPYYFATHNEGRACCDHCTPHFLIPHLLLHWETAKPKEKIPT